MYMQTSVVGQGHGVSPDTRVTADMADHVARIMGALAAGSRVRILSCLREGPRTVGELTEAVGMAQPAVSHQLRILRDLGLVVGSRSSRNVIYELFDSHVAGLLDETLRHIEHLRTAPDPPLHRPTGDRYRSTDDARRQQ